MIISNAAFAIYDPPLWSFAVLASKLHLVWVKTICGRLKTDLRYSNTMGWNTFPVPTLTEKNKIDLTRSAEDILLLREKFFPKSLASLYESGKLPKDLEEIHNKNDEIIERIYIGREFKNDSERLEKLFDMYSKKTKAKI